MGRNQRIVVCGIDQAYLRPSLGALPQALCDQRMILAQERPYHQYTIELVDRGDRHAQPCDARLQSVARKIALAQAMIDVLAAERTRELLRQMQLFKR